MTTHPVLRKKLVSRLQNAETSRAWGESRSSGMLKREILRSDSLVLPVESRCDVVPTCDFDPGCCRLRSALVSQIIVPISYGFGSRESFSAQAAHVLPRTRDPTTATHRRDPFDSRTVVSMVHLEGCPNHRQAGNLDWLASKGIPFILALEVQAVEDLDCRRTSES